MQGFSFKEYVNKVKNLDLKSYKIEEILKNSNKITETIYKKL
jgi:hypothetical protein